MRRKLYWNIVRRNKQTNKKQWKETWKNVFSHLYPAHLNPSTFKCHLLYSFFPDWSTLSRIILVMPNQTLPPTLNSLQLNFMDHKIHHVRLVTFLSMKGLLGRQKKEIWSTWFTWISARHLTGFAIIVLKKRWKNMSQVPVKLCDWTVPN